ncbi:MAG: hypothetical protein OJF52_002151 [Nitrospira sp.]|jgi:putative two-component system response regulator|nr:MAG: hypothetical protein OJF52_002151 [Nitrospira sp.]
MERPQAPNASRLDLIWRLGRLAEFREEQTGSHVVRAGSYCQVMAEVLGMGCDVAEMNCFTSPLQDIGKIGRPNDIFLQPCKLTPEKWNIMRRHYAIGADILRQDLRCLSSGLAASWNELPDRNSDGEPPFLTMTASIVLMQHEWWNGTGYHAAYQGNHFLRNPAS